MRFPIEVEYHRKAGSVIAVMPPELVIITLYLVRKLYVPTTLTLISHPTDKRLMILRTSYDYLPDLISEFRTLSLMVKLPVTNEITNGENTPG